MTPEHRARLDAKFARDARCASAALERAQMEAKAGRFMAASKSYREAGNAFGRMAETRDLIAYLSERAA